MKNKHLKFIGRELRPLELRLLAKWALRLKRRIVELGDGRRYEVDPISDLGINLATTGEYESKLAAEMLRILITGGSFIDVGANEGYFSVLGSKAVGPTGRVFAIEPQARLWPVIIRNAFLNSCANIQLLPYGLSASTQEMKLQLYPSTNTGASTFTETFGFKVSMGWYRKRLFGSQESKVVALDEIQEALPATIDLAKIDIEGFEFEALKGAEDILSQGRIKRMLIEIHENALRQMGQSEEMIDGLLAKHGYRKSRISHNLNLYELA